MTGYQEILDKASIGVMVFNLHGLYTIDTIYIKEDP